MAVIIQDSVSETTRQAITTCVKKFPELDREVIIFRHAPIFTTMNAIPRKDFFFRKRRYRVYHINISRKNRHGIFLDGLNFKEQVGCIAHELVHIVDYTRMSTLQVCVFGLRYYLSNSYRRFIEHRTDKSAIKRGFGSEIYAYAQTLDQLMTGRYRRFKEKNYMSSYEISAYMDALQDVEFSEIFITK